MTDHDKIVARDGEGSSEGETAMIGKIAGTCLVAGLMLGTSVAADAQRYFARQRIGPAQSATSNGEPSTSCVSKGNLTYYTSPNNGVSNGKYFTTKAEAVKKCQDDSLSIFKQLGAQADQYEVACDVITQPGSFYSAMVADKKGQLVLYNPLPASYEGFEGYYCTYSK